MRAVALLIILAVLPVLLLAPLGPGSVRLGGVGLAWWYGGAVGELLALALAILLIRPAR